MFSIIEKYKFHILLVFVVLLFIGLILLYFYISSVKKDLLTKINGINEKLEDSEDKSELVQNNLMNNPNMFQPNLNQNMIPGMNPIIMSQMPMNIPEHQSRMNFNNVKPMDEVEPIYNYPETPKPKIKEEKQQRVSFKTEVEEIDEPDENENDDDLDAEIADELKELEEDIENEDLKNDKE